MKTLGRWRRETLGASVVTYAFILPLFVVLVFGTFQVWRVISVRQSLSLGTYQAARYISSHGRTWLGPNTPSSAWEGAAREAAETIVNDELEENDLLPAGYRLQVQVVIDAEGRDDPARLGWLFSVRSELYAPNLVSLPPLELGTVTLVERQVSFIEGLSGDWVPPEDTGPY